MLKSERTTALRVVPTIKKGTSALFVWLWASFGILLLLCLSPMASELYLSGLGLPLALGLLLGVTGLTLGMRSHNSLSIKNFFTLFYAIYYTVPATIAVVDARWSTHLNRWNVSASPVLLHLIALAALGLAAFVVGYKLPIGAGLGKRITAFVQNKDRQVDQDKLKHLLALAVLPLGLAFVWELRRTGGLSALIMLEYTEVLDFALGWVQRGVLWIPPLLICLALVARTDKRWSGRIALGVGIALLALSVTATLATQSRGRGLLPLMGLLLLLHYQIKPLSKLSLILLAILTLPAINSLALLRAGQLSAESVSDLFRSLRYIGTQQDLLLGEGPALFGLNYMIVESILTGQQPLLGGWTHLATLARWLPDTLAFWVYDLLGVEQFNSVAVWIMRTYFPAAYAGPRIGFATLVLIEPYINFGWVGVIPSLLGIGIISKTLDTVLEKGRPSPLAHTIGIIAATETLFWVRGGSLIIRQLLYALLPLMMVYLAATLITRKRYQRIVVKSEPKLEV